MQEIPTPLAILMQEAANGDTVACSYWYHHARCFDPTTGRWLNQEPMGFDASQDNLFRYPQ